MKIEVSIGEIVDKLSILDIKRRNITDPVKLENVCAEFEYLHNIVFNELNIDLKDYIDLITTNECLWNIEDRLRRMEAGKYFDDIFIEYARQVYITNDKRAEQKRNINVKYGSKFIEEKSYEKY